MGGKKEVKLDIQSPDSADASKYHMQSQHKKIKFISILCKKINKKKE